MKNLVIKYILGIAFLVGNFAISNAQCNINDFVLTANNGICIQDGSIDISIPGAAGCTSVTAFLYEAGATTDVGTIVLTSSGTGTFSNLAPGNYEVRLFQGSTITPRKPVTVSTSYNLLNVSGTPTNITCSSGDPLFSNNGSIEINFSGGIGPYTISLSGPVNQTVNVASPTSHTFTGLPAGSYIATVTDNSASCVASESRSFTITETVYPALSFYYDRTTLSSSDCSKLIYRISFLGGTPGGVSTNQANCYITVNGVNYPPTSVLITGGQSILFWDGILEDQDVIQTLYVTDGCKEVTRVNRPVRQVPLDFLFTSASLNNCGDGVTIGVNGNQNAGGYIGSWAFQQTNNLKIFQETAYGSNVWSQVNNVNNLSYLSFNGGQYLSSYNDTTVRYKVVASDACHTVEKIVDPTMLTYTNPLSFATIIENKGIYNGTSSITVKQAGSGGYYNQVLSNNANYPINIHIERADGATSVPVVSDGPLDLAGTYNVTFPRDVLFESSASNALYFGLTVGDLPMGEYNITLTDACGDSFQHTITLNEPADFANSIEVDPGCASSNIIFDLTGNNVYNAQILSELLLNDNGSPSTIIRTFNENPSRLLNGQFSNVPPGDYFVKLSGLKYKYIPTIGYYPNTSYSLINDIYMNEKSVIDPVTVGDFGSVSFTNTSLFCDDADPNSGLLAILVEGTPVGFINYEIWAPGADPATDPPLDSYNTTDLSETEFVFQGLSDGLYTVKVSTECGFLQQEVNLVQGSFSFPAPVSLTGSTYCEVENIPNELFVPLSENLFDIEWKNGTGIVIGTGNTLLLDPAPTSSETITVSYQLKTSLGCTNTYQNTSDITLNVIPAFVGPTIGTPLASKVGISALNRMNRINNNGDWPENINNGNLVLESKSLGLVLNRIPTTAALTNIANPVEGMIVFDVEADCIKMYTSINNGATYDWYCMTTQTCTNNN